MKTLSLQLEAKPNSKQVCLGLGLLCLSVCNCNPLFQFDYFEFPIRVTLFSPMGCIYFTENSFFWQTTVL